MIKVLFVCHGNICRSPMAEFVFRDLVTRRGMASDFLIASAATSTEELGNPVHPGTRNKLRACGVPMADHRSVQLTRADYEKYDLLLGMDSRNLENMRPIVGPDKAGKLHRLLDFTPAPRDIADPWYTGDFDLTYRDVVEGCQALLKHLLEPAGQGETP